MSILYFMIPFALVMGAIFVGGFLWMANSDQYDDLDTPAIRILFNELPVRTGPLNQRKIRYEKGRRDPPPRVGTRPANS